MDRPALKPLLALALAAFGIGTTEFVVMGLLPDVARDLGVSIPAAGLLVSGYALGVTLGGPALSVLMARTPGRSALLGLMALFVIGNIGCALAPDYASLMVARAVTAFCHAAFFGVGAVIAADLAAPGKRAQAIALMVSGLTIANILGVPLGTMIGQSAGWRATFWAVAALGVLSWAALAAWVPRQASPPRDLKAEWRILRLPAVWLTLATSTVASTSMFTFFTYVTPILVDVSGLRTEHVGWVLLVCGVGLTFGNLIGARLADWRPLPSLAASFALVALILIAFAWTGRTPSSATVSIFLWGAVSFAACATLQAEIVEQARAAPNLASTLNISAFNFGNALGAGLGALAIANGMPLSGIPVVAGVVAAVAMALTILAIVIRRGRARGAGPAAVLGE